MRSRLVGDERAGTTLVAAALILVMLLTGVFLHDVTALYGARGQAQTAADAAAKAAGLELSPYFGVGGRPREAAEEYAGRNGACLEEFGIGGRERYIWVTVSVSRRVDHLLLKNSGAVVKATARCYLDLDPESRSP